MSIYALFPLIATIAYIPLLVSTVSSRPWHRRHALFVLFLIAAMSWSLVDYLFRSNFFPQYNALLFKAIVIIYALMATQFHCFLSSFYLPGQRRWLPFAYVSLVVIIVAVLSGYVTGDVIVNGDKIHGSYKIGVLVMFIPLMALVARNFYVFGKRLRILDSPVLYNQIISLMIGLVVLVIFTLTALIPWGKDFPISHFGNLINAFILSYATVRHQLVDIRIVLRRGLAWATLGIIGGICYWLLLGIVHIVLDFELDLTATFIATAVAIVAAVVVFRMRGLLFTGISRVFQGQSYDYRRALSDFAGKIHNVFSLRKQGGELLELVTKALDCNRACLLFPEAGNEGFTAQLFEPRGKDNPLCNLKLAKGNPILEYLGEEQRALSREDLAILVRFRSLWERERKEIESNGIELFMPLISRDKLIAILVLGKKLSGRYSLEDISLLKDVADRVAVSMEKEYLREQLREREEELSVINRSSVIITSSLDIQEIYDSFINELKKVVDVDWAAIILIKENELYILALSSDTGSSWEVGESVPIKGTATEWVAAHKETVVELDLAQEVRFDTGKYHLEHGIRSIVYLPLVAKGEIIGTLTVGSRKPGAYSQRQVTLLEQLASQIAMPVDTAQLYAKVEEQARFDELTGLLNRRSLNEMITNEVGRHSRYGGIFSVIILDLDSFKAFNDNYGHLAGDKLLRQIGGIIKGAIRTADQAFRYGGDEFAVLCPQTAIDAGKKVAERVRKQIALKVKAGHIPITASLGLSTWPADGIGPSEILAAADAALYHAKRSGGNRSHCASGTLLPVDDIMFSFESTQSSDSLGTIYSLATTVDARCHYSRHHSKKVNEYSLALAEALHLEPVETSQLETSALLHDIGKIGINDEILNKPGELTDEEWVTVKQHPQLGATIVGRVRQLAHCVAGILHHHERYDGSGYPKGLRGENIPLEARILAIADAFAAMTSERPYSDAMSCEEALEVIKQAAGTQFDPRLVEVFLSIKATALLPEERM